MEGNRDGHDNLNFLEEKRPYTGGTLGAKLVRQKFNHPKVQLAQNFFGQSFFALTEPPVYITFLKMVVHFKP